MTDLLIEQMSDYHFQENIIHPLQIVCRQLSNILAELRQWGKQHRSFNEDCKIIDCRCSTHNIRCHSSSEPRTDGCDSLKLTSKLAEGTEPKLPYSNPGSRDALFQLFNGSAEETECKCPYTNPSLRDNPIHLASGPNEMRDIKFPHCDQGPRDVTDQEAQNESISQIQKIEENKSDLNDRYCLSKAIQKNLTLLIDALPYRGSELPDYLGEECLTDNENSRIRGNEQREDQIRLLLRTIMGRSFCDMKHFLDFARKFNPDEVDNVWKTYDELKREGNVEKRCIICLVMAYVDIKYVADIMYEKDLIPDSLFGRASDCKGSFGCQSKLWKELCRLFHQCIYKDAMVETLINALEKKSKYRYLAEELRRCDGEVFATLKCRCETTQQLRKKYSQCTRQTRPVLSVRTGPRGSSSGTTSPSPWSSYSDISSGWNADIRRSSCFRRKEFAQFYKRGRSLHHKKRQQKDNTETVAKSPCNSNNEMFERYTTLECPKSSIISSLQSSHEDMVHNDAYDSQIPSKRMPFQDYVPTTHYYNSRVCEGDGFNNNDEAVFPKGLQKMLSAFLKDVMHYSEYQKDMSVGGDRSMTPDHNNLLATGIISNCSCSLTSGQIQTNKRISTSTVETISSQNISSIQTSIRCENKQRQASEAFCSANQSGERIKYEMKTHMETEEEEHCVISNSTNEEEQCVISNGMNEEEQCVISNSTNEEEQGVISNGMNEEEQCVISNGMNGEEQCVLSNGMNQEEQCVISNSTNEEEQCVILNGMNEEEQCVISNDMNEEEQCVLSNGMNEEEQCVISNGMNQEEQCVIANGMNQEEQCVISNGMNEEKFTITSDNESDLLDTETSNSIAKTENEFEKMLITSSGQNRLQSKRPSLTRGLAIDSIGCNMKNDSSKTEETLSNVDESEAGILPGSINNGDSNNAHARHLLK